VKRFTISALAIGMLLVGFGSAQPAQAATSTKTVRYGPFTIPAGTATDPGMVHNKLLLWGCPALTDRAGGSVRLLAG
jgi:hypothetical protein